MDERTRIGYLGECFVRLELAKLGIYSIEVSWKFDYDLLTANGARIEVKTAHLTSSGRHPEWHFLNKITKANRISRGKYKIDAERRDRRCDFFILVCIGDGDAVVQSFVVPKQELGQIKNISIFPEYSESKWAKWRNRWDLIQAFLH